MRSFALCLLLLVASQSSAELRIAVTDSFYETLQTIAARYQQQYRKPVQLVPGQAGVLFERIRNGADFDVFFSADIGYPRQLIAAGIADADSFVVYASGELALWCPQLSGTPSLGSLTPSTTVAIANPQTVPYGRAAKELLQREGLWDDQQRRIAIEDSMTGVMSALISGTATCGFVSYGQWLGLPADERGSVWRAPARKDSLLKQAAIVMKRSPKRWEGRDFLVFMRSPEAFEILRQQGYRLTGSPLQPPPPLSSDEQ